MRKIITFYTGLWITLYLLGFDFRFKLLSLEDLFSRFNQSGDNFDWEFEAKKQAYIARNFEPDPEKCVEGPTEHGFNFCISNN